MEITKLEGGGRVPPTLQGGTPVSTSSPVSLTGTTHTQKIESSMPQSGDYSVCGCVSAAAPLSAASQLMADAGCKQQTIPDYDIPSQSGERCLGLAVPVSHSAANLNQKSVIVSCVVSPPSPTAGGCPPLGGQMSALTSGPQTTTTTTTDVIKNNDTEQDTDNNRRAMGYTNAISNTNCSSIDVYGCDTLPSSTATTTPTTPSSSTPGCSQCAACEPVTASLSECPPSAGPSSNTMTSTSPVITSTGECSKPKPNKTRLSQDYVQPLHGWKLPPGGGLRGGAPLPGETSAISNGTSGWGPPPSSSVHSSGTGAWGSAPPPNNGAGAWGSASSNGLGGGNAPGGPNAGGDDLGQSNQKLLNSSGGLGGGPVSSAASGVVGVSAANVMTSQQQQPTANNSVAPAMPPSAVGGSTSWAAAAGKGLPPQPEPTPNGAANKPIEVLNSLREALYSPDGWGGQNVKQDTSWDIGGSVPEPAVPTIAVKQDAMQWQSTSTGRNDGTDLWKSNLSGVPPPVKPQPQTPWGNHTPAHPADYKTWGEPEDDNNGPSADNNRGQQGGGPIGGGPGPVDPRGRGNMGGDNGVGGGNSWDDGPGAGPPQQGQGAPQPNNQPWDTDPGKGKDDNWGTPAPSANQWGSSAQISAPSNMQMEPRGGMDGNGGGGGWGAPPPVKPASAAGGGWGAPQGPARGSGADQWHSESPSAARRMDDGGTSIWGKSGGQSGAPGGGWKDMPVPNLGPRAPPGPPTRMPPGGPGMKPGDASPWGNPQLQGRGWGDDPMTPSNPWDDKQRDMGMSVASSGNGMPDLWRKPMRTSPSWEDSVPGGGGDMRGWGNGGGNRPQFTKETIRSSKQFRVLMDMNFRMEDAETALRTTNMQLEDAIDLLNNMNRGGQMPGNRGGGMPPSADSGFGGPRGGGDPSYGDMRFPNPGGPGGMPYPPVDGLPPGSANPSLQNTSRGNMNPALVQQMTMMSGGGGPPRPPQSGTPSTSQLRLLVQQIQMAVQAGHLNAQILNQPLAPQTLLLLNQLLQQIKLLQQCKSQQQQCMTSRGGQNNQALLALSVQITKHNQNITNLQNQITVQQAQYLKSQQPASSMAAIPPPADPSELNLNLSNLSLTADQQQAAAQQHQAQGSKLNKWIKNDNSDDFSRAPGSSKSSTSQPSPNVLLEGGSTWSNGNNGAVSGGSGWPDSNDKNSNNNATDDTDFGIPEFVPGKAWKGSSLKDPSEDPTLTPGSVAANPLLHSQPHNDMKSSSSMIMSSQSSAAANSSAVENSLGLTSTTWSFGNSAGGAKDMMSNGSGVGGWGSGLPPSSSTSNLTTMGQDLWGMGPRGGGKPSGMSGWPSAAGGGGMSNGWSNGSNMPGAGGSAWLLLKNLTAQIDGSTLRTLCMQHGPLNNFQLFLTHGIALAKYSNGSEAKKAQNALNNCVLGNTTILAVVADEHEVETIVRSLSQGSSQRGPPTSNPSFSNYSALAKSSSADSWSNLWSTGGGGGVGGGSVWGAPDDQHNRTTPLNSFIPTDLLSETM